MDYGKFISQPDCVPLHNEIRRAMEHMPSWYYDSIQKHWDQVMTHVQDVMRQHKQLKPDSGPYICALAGMTIGAQNAAEWIRKDNQREDVSGIYGIIDYAQRHQDEAALRDEALAQYWDQGARSYSALCTSCSSSDIDLLAERTLEYANSMIFAEPTRLICDIFYRAVQQAAADIANHTPNAGVANDMKMIRQHAASQILLIQSIPFEPFEVDISNEIEEER